MSEENELGDMTNEADYPVMEVDMRLFSVYVAGTSEEDLDDVEEKINRQVAERLEEVKSLKRHDQELAQEYAEGSDTARSRYSQ